MRSLICLLTLALAAGATQAQIPQLLSYQGKLLDDAGDPVPDGDYAMEFRFYDACTDGNLLLTDDHVAVQTRDGIYSVLLGGGSIVPAVEPDLLSVFGNHDLVCLGVQVEADVEMVPRQQIVSSGFALRAAVSDGGSAVSTFVEADDDVTWTGVNTFDETTIFADGQSLAWPHITGDPAPTSSFRITKFNSIPPGQSTHPNGEADEQWMICYNCQEGATFPEDSTQHAWNQKIEATYWDGVTESLEYNWNYTSPVGKKWRPFAFRLFVDGLCSNDASFCVDDADCGTGNTCDGANRASFSWNTRPDNTVADFELVRSSGRVRFRNGLEGYITHDGGTGATSLPAFHLISTIDNADTSSGPVIFAISLENDFASSTDNAQVSDMLGLRSKNIFSGAASGRDVVGQMIAVDAWNTIEQTGGGSPTADRVIGLRYKFDPLGQAVTIGESDGLRIETPTALAPTLPVVVEQHVGVRILDQRGLGTVEGDALVINAQTLSPDPSRGNLNLKGGGWNDGHLVLENGHLWMDKTNATLRFQQGTPAGETDGKPLHAPPGSNTSWGAAFWGSDASNDHDTGDEVCALAQLTCKETYAMGSAVPVSCSTSTHSTLTFLVLCY